MDSSVASLQSSSSSAPAHKPFPFFDLPSELRIRIYEFVLWIDHGEKTIDLDVYNHRRIAPRLTCFLACRQMHNEAYPIFYGSPQQPFRLFPTGVGGYNVYKIKKPLLAQLGPTYRGTINTLELRLGPGFSRIPKSWHTGPELGLTDCVSLRTLKVLVQTDPTDKIFDGHRGKDNDENTYTNLCVGWLRDVMEQAPSLENIEIDSWDGVSVDSPLLHALTTIIADAKKKLTWGPTRRKKLERE